MKEWGDPLFCLYYEVNGLSNRKKGGNTVDVVWKLAAPIAAGLGLTIWDVRFVKEGAGWFLRIFIDKEGGVGIEDCEAMSRAIDDPLDQLDPIDQSYCLEVSSPGMERELVREEHFWAFLGAKVRAKLFHPLEDGRRELIGTLRDFQEGTIILETEKGETVSLAQKDASSVRLVEDDIVGGIEE
ncbi:ribosome maturation factor RimP [Caproiciproducens galactitolivorans]|uniref:Ribosome maturation factor RimP n=1 Tax=Caproiciproducens galactitolivorans TaxID=642589 RepID=A0A4Z0YCV8_9FIRM|nr:ribosome maturation factor RimP [Caproiciproducens galactitolivorans]TGJ76633.1 ribosome maturation factor RimP [Caproiciproducens galactitolivorans]